MEKMPCQELGRAFLFRTLEILTGFQAYITIPITPPVLTLGQNNVTHLSRLTYAMLQALIVKIHAIILAISEFIISQSICKTTVKAVMLKAMII